MKNLIRLFTVIALVAIFASSVYAFRRNPYYWFGIFNEDGQSIESGLTFEVIDSDGDTLSLYANSYSTTTTITNPDSVANLTPKGVVGFYQARGVSYGVKLTDSSGNVKVIDDIGTTDHRAIFVEPVTQRGSLSFAVETDTNTTPSRAGQIVMDSNFNLFMSTVTGGSWYKIITTTSASTSDLGQ